MILKDSLKGPYEGSKMKGNSLHSEGIWIYRNLYEGLSEGFNEGCRMKCWWWRDFNTMWKGLEFSWIKLKGYLKGFRWRVFVEGYMNLCEDMWRVCSKIEGFTWREIGFWKGSEYNWILVKWCCEGCPEGFIMKGNLRIWPNITECDWRESNTTEGFTWMEVKGHEVRWRVHFWPTEGYTHSHIHTSMFYV